MYAVIKTGGKQYRVAKGDIVIVEKLAAEAGETVQVGDVLMIGEDGKAPEVGTPILEKAAVTAEVVDQGKGDKVVVFKKKRRHNYRRKKGHRQLQTVLRVTEISKTGKKAAAPKKEAEAKAEAPADKKAAAPKKAPAKKAAPKKKAAAKKAPAKKAQPKKTTKKTEE
jgi:large subunit ribosomal protein L21